MDTLIDKVLIKIFTFFGYAIGMGFKGIIYLIKRAIYMKKMEPQMVDSLPLDTRFEHIHIVGGTGHGKTQLLQQLIFSDIIGAKEGYCSAIVIDSQGDLIGKILWLADMKELSDRLILIDPSDINNPPALNLFDLGLDRLNKLNPVDREKLINGTISLYEYLFGALLGAELSQRQSVIFRYLARLMMVVPNVTIHNLMDFMQEPETVRPYLAKLDPMSKRFFETQFFASSFDPTRQQILTRLWGVLSNPVLARMFSNERNKVDLFDAINRSSIILIYTAKDLLKQEGCEILGRFFIALISQAAQERASIPENMRLPAFVYIDEAHDYFDENIENLLVQARKYKVGLVLAHQNLDQFDQKLRATVMANTSIKIAGGVSTKDANYLAQEMRCLPEQIMATRKVKNCTYFYKSVKGQEPGFLAVPLGLVEREPRLTKEEMKVLRDKIREKYCGTLEETAPAKPMEVEVEGVSKHEML